MTKRKLFLFCVVLLIGLMACGLFSRDEAPAGEPPVPEATGPEVDAPNTQPEAEPTAEETEVVPTENPEPTATVPQIPLGDNYRSEVGGYRFHTIPEATIEEDDGFTIMIAPGGNSEIGPAIIMYGEALDTESTLDEVFTKQLENMDRNNNEFTDPQNVMVGGAKGLSFDVTGVADNSSMGGRIIIVLVNPNQMFMIGGMAPLDEWESFSAVFEGVQESVSFFEPTAAGAPQGNIQPKEDVIRQWAKYANASSSYGDPDWDAVQATGKPDVPSGECLDHQNAWASESPNTIEWLELIYETTVIPTEINILQTHSPDQVTQVEVLDGNEEYHEVYTGEPQNLWDECPYTLSIPVDVGYGVNGVRITLDQSVIDTPWNEIDAVELVGNPLDEETSEAPPETEGDTAAPDDGLALQDPPVPSSEAGQVNERLLELGYEICSVSDFFSPQTESAVKEFQRINDLESSGVVDTDTWVLLFSETALPADRSAQEFVFSEPLEGISGDKLASSGSLLWVLSSGFSFLEAYDTQTGELAGIFSVETLPGEDGYYPQAIAYDKNWLWIASIGDGDAIVQAYDPNTDPTTGILSPQLSESIYLDEILAIRGLSYDGQHLWLAYESTAYPSGIAEISRLANEVVQDFQFGLDEYASAPAYDMENLWAAFEGVVMGDAVLAVDPNTGVIGQGSGFCGYQVAHDLAGLWVAKEYEVLAVHPYGGGSVYGWAKFDSMIKDMTFSGARIYLLFEDGNVRFYQVY